MEPIIKVIVEMMDIRDGHMDKERHFFHGIVQAKLWCERDVQKSLDQKEKYVIEWEQATHVNPLAWWSPEIDLPHNDLIVTYDLSPIEITVLDEEDGEV